MSTEPANTGASSGGSKAVADDAPRYGREELAEFLGVSPAVIAGAFETQRNQTFTLEAAQKIVEKFGKYEPTVELAQQDEEE